MSRTNIVSEKNITLYSNQFLVGDVFSIKNGKLSVTRNCGGGVIITIDVILKFHNEFRSDEDVFDEIEALIIS